MSFISELYTLSQKLYTVVQSIDTPTAERGTFMKGAIDDEIDIEFIVRNAMKMGAGYCDVRLERARGTSLEVKNGDLKKAISGNDMGVGVRILYKGAWGFFSTNDLSRSMLKRALEQALKLAKVSSANIKKEDRIHLAETPIVSETVIWKPKKDPNDVSIEDKHALIAEMDKRIREFNEILTVETGYSDGTKKMYFLNSEGTEIITELTRTVAQANLIAKKNGDLTSYRVRIGGTAGFEIFDMVDPIEKGVEGALSAIRILSAEKAPSGRLPVIADPDLVGVFVHEALGHAAEADIVVSGESVLEGMMGRKIASEIVTIIDDPTLEGGFGSFPYDDEGVKGQRKVLIENGVLKNFILDRKTGYKLKRVPNGGARAESFAAQPLVRMSNTILLGTDDLSGDLGGDLSGDLGGEGHSSNGRSRGLTFDELIEDIKFGVYAKGTLGGEVDTAKGAFQFSAQESYLIEKGEVTKPLKEVSLSGRTLDILMNIDAIGKRFEFGTPGFCGKGQLVPVGDGGPHIRIKEAIVGGG